MPGKRLTVPQHALIVLAVRASGNVQFAQWLSEQYLYGVQGEEDAAWLDSLIWEGEHTMPAVGTGASPWERGENLEIPMFDVVTTTDPDGLTFRRRDLLP